jgi:type IV pilus assembly protein PilV
VAAASSDCKGIGKMKHRQSVHCAGFSLIEVLVAAAVLGVGLAGLAALLLNGISSTASSLSRSSAALHTESMTELARISPLGASEFIKAVPVSPPACDTTRSCSPAEFARHSLWHWQQRVLQDLPGGSAEICVAGGSIETASGTANCELPLAVVRWSSPMASGKTVVPNRVFLGLPL